ncbi:PREDICTED: tumor necrosis factor receptor superfamily member 18 [Chrysochloris asiatica]|uniref:Tumor necrosis factor receptor superfamily member 18 n=1 Tax=Chrysochloris asiatica TaxID=185453 RepID=A0A9B0TUU4_CHRAS|nr:PREDICTED: tumor necrosis factor receptor superfamily member 18 [Chrysochloris asiatica]
MCSLVTWCSVALLWSLSLGQNPNEGSSCGPGRILRGNGNNSRCCRTCPPSMETCPERDCMCVQPEYHCGDPECNNCKHHPCPLGKEAQAQGNFKFGFTCIDCAPGTFSEDHAGHCKPRADCSRLGFSTVFPGNKTHNTVCSPVSTTEPCHLLTLVLLAMATCILVLAATQLGLCIWELRRTRVWHRGTQLPLELSPAEDSRSYQFPEEERGERLVEDKGHGRHRDLWV